MAYLGRVRKSELQYIADELGFDGVNDLKAIELVRLITSADDYDEEFTRVMVDRVIEERVAEEQKMERRRALELARWKPQLSALNPAPTSTTTPTKIQTEQDDNARLHRADDPIEAFYRKEEPKFKAADSHQREQECTTDVTSCFKVRPVTELRRPGVSSRDMERAKTANPVPEKPNEGDLESMEQRREAKALLTTSCKDTFSPGGELTPKVVAPCIHPDDAPPVQSSQAWKTSHPVSTENLKWAEQPPQSDQTSVTVALRSPNGNEVTRSATSDVLLDQQQMPIPCEEVIRSASPDVSRKSSQMLTQHPQGDDLTTQMFEPVVDTTPTGMENNKVTKSASPEVSHESCQVLTKHPQGDNPSPQVFEPVVDTTSTGVESDIVIRSAPPDVSRKSCLMSNQYPQGDNPSPQVLDPVVDTTPTGMENVNTGVTSTHTSVVSDSDCVKTNPTHNGTPTAMDGDRPTSTGKVTVYFVKTVHLDPKTVYVGRRPKFRQLLCFWLLCRDVYVARGGVCNGCL